ncbi:SRPBCC family protein [Nocardia sp. NBC_01329]|uniref:SRPBCC family protein n=1 Tax=Nocardia sp. NBC_01329 TaxID=2903594 RepID=UPI002E1289F7|nr:SRPBCC family protein [Nocardia sp. NBC_01329]
MATTRIQREIAAPRATVYAALVDGEAVRTWMVPTGMTSRVHEFDATEGGRFRISLTYDDPAQTGKTEGATDTFHGRFATLVPDERVVQIVEFDTADPAITGEMRITYDLTGTPAGTRLDAVHEGLPDGVSEADNELGWSISLGKLAALAEGRAIPD